ncbi:hypothetical protein HS088_TW11G00446 [Tripterygium wilfordii]|uniref:PWWP domain-containing protein n=1 Tax=Tripterygium wilfordii TaxID=458696 RepID=A0A7J7D200_TRIWF|nr:serine/threonine-protein kinase ATM-like [Tripterygium wilfordii]KAF5740377.1 hypothetical protein HS088_TW11G00446 [Tripterygium wilfordii]
MEEVGNLPKTGTRSGSVAPKCHNADSKPLKEASGTSISDSCTFREITQENGVRVFVNGKEDVPAGGYSEDSEMNGVSSLLKMRETQEEVGRGGESGCAMDKIDEHKVTGDGLPGEGGVPIVASGAQIGVEESKDCGEREECDDYFNAKENFGEMSEGDDEDGEEMIDNSDDDDDGGGYKFKVGDFVWGKIRSHPWWPGRVYDPSEASDYALKMKRRNKILVAYFGDGTFAWCKPSQLKPFDEGFEKISRHSSSRNFIHAVEAALDEIGQLVELKLASFMKEGYSGALDRPLAVTSGIKEGVFVPEGGIEKFITDFLEPAEFLTHLKLIARIGDAKSMLEFTVFKSWVSAFYGDKGFCQCPVFREPQLISGLEDKTKNSEVDMINDRGLQVRIPGPVEEDWLALSGGPRFGQINQSLLQKCSGVTEGRLYHKRKQKSIAEIIGMNVEAEDEVRELTKVKTDSDKPASTSKMNKRKDTDGVDGDDANNSASVRRRKRKARRLSESLLATESKVSNVDHDGSVSNEGTGNPSLSTGRKKKSRSKNDGGGSKEETDANQISTSGYLGVGNDHARAKEEIEMASSPRERKKSKYLSFPYTNLNQGQRKKGKEADSLKASEEERVGEQMNRAASHLIGFSPIMKCTGDNQGKLLKDSDVTSPQSSNHDQCNVIDPRSLNISASEVLSGIQTVALCLQYLKENNSQDLDMVYQFFYAFRSSVYHDGFNHHDYNNLQLGMKRTAQDSGPDISEKYLNANYLCSSENESQHKKIKRIEDAKSKPRNKTAAGLADVERNEKESDVKASSVVLFVTFGQGSSLPSKNDLIRIYSNFGALNKELTDVMRDDFCCRVVFVNASDAETALKSSQLVSPFGADTSTFQLCYLLPDVDEEGAHEAELNTKEKDSDGDKQSSNLADTRTGEKPCVEDSGAALFVTFGPGSSIPSKNDLINIYSEYGVLSENETDMFYQNFCARIVFVRTSDGEAAFNSSQLISPFRSSRVTFRLRYLSSASRAKELMEIPSPKISPPPKKGVKTQDKPAAPQSSVKEGSRLNYIRQKLQLMTSILEKSDERSYQETKSRLEGEIKGLVEKVSTMEGSSSS